jgi:replicative DNA helicase
MDLTELRAAALNPPLPAGEMAADPLPHDLQAESWVLGNISKRPALLDTLGLVEADFYVLRNRHAYRAMRALHASGSAWDFWALAERMAESFSREVAPLSHTDALLHVTGYDWERCFWETPEFAERVKDSAERRRLIDAAQRIAEGAWSGKRPFGTEDAARLLERGRRQPTHRPVWERAA